MVIFTPVYTLCAEVIADLKAFSWKSNTTATSLRATLACMAALLLAWIFNINNPAWAALTAFVVVQASRGATLVQTFERIAATLLSVFVALLLLSWFGDNVMVMMGLAIAALTLCFYFSAKSKTPFVWIFGPITFLVILFSAPGIERTQIANLAYYRALEITLGSLCGLGVTLLFGAPLALHNVQKNNIELLRSLGRLVAGGGQSFKEEHEQLLKLADAQSALLRFARHEGRFQSLPQNHDLQLEQTIFMAQEVWANIYDDHHGDHQAVMDHFKSAQVQIKKRIQQSLEAMIVSLETRCQNRDAVLQSLDLWHQNIEALFKKTEQFRNAHALEFAPQEWINWYQWLVRQEEFFMMRDFYQQVPILPKITQHSKAWRQWFFKDAYHWEYAFKTALAGGLSPLAALYFDLPSGVFLAVVIILCLQVDVSVMQRKLFLLVMGSGLGTLLALAVLSLNIENVVLYIPVIAGVLFVLGLLVHGNPSRSFVGIFAMVLFLVSLTPGIGPTQDWRNTILLFFEIAVTAVMLVILLVWIWPFSVRKIFKHYQDQVNWYQDLIQSFILQSVLAVE